MNRVRIVFVVVLSLFVGGVVMEQGAGLASPDRDRDAPRDSWGAPPVPPAPPAAPVAPTPPTRGRRGGVSISVRDGKVRIQGIDQMVAGHLQMVREMLRNNPNIPRDLRDKILARLDRVKAIVDRHLKNLSSTDIDKLDDELAKMGDELDRAMEGLDADLDKLGDKLAKGVAKDLAKNLGKGFVKGLAKKNFQFHFGDDDSDVDVDRDADADADDDDADSDNDSDADNDSDDVRIAVDDLKGFALKPSQRDAIARLRAVSDAQVATATQQLEQASRQLEAALADVRVSDRDVSRYVDQITSHEATIRKARLLAWVAARRVLDADQVKQLEKAAHESR